MKRTFLIITEKKRVKNRVSFYISEIIDGKVKLLDNDFTVSTKSNHGLVNEALNRLVKLKHLDDKYISDGGYKNDPEKDLYIIHIEGDSLNYVNLTSNN